MYQPFATSNYRPYLAAAGLEPATFEVRDGKYGALDRSTITHPNYLPIAEISALWRHLMHGMVEGLDGRLFSGVKIGSYQGIQK